MKKYIGHIQRIFDGTPSLPAVVMVLSLLISTAMPATVWAAQLNGRSITMSDSGPSAGTITTGVGSGTNVAYQLKFSVGNNGAVGGIVVDFCANSPLYFDTCTAPTGFNANSATTTLGTQSGVGAGGNFGVYTTGPVANRIVLTRASASSLTSPLIIGMGNGTSNGFTNPSTVGTFYARIYTYTSAAQAQAHNQTAATGGEQDFGGVALSTAMVITITARVQESLIFCVSGAAPAANCGGVTTPAITLGHTAGGTAKIIDSSNVDTGFAYTQVSTNALSGVVIRMHNSNACGGLSVDGGTTCDIPPVNAGGATPFAMTAGTAGFGMNISLGTSGTGTITPDGNYYDGNVAHFAMDSTTSGSNVTTTFGDNIASSTGPVSNVNNTLTFGATASNSTPAGLYSANLALIATGTF